MTIPNSSQPVTSPVAPAANLAKGVVQDASARAAASAKAIAPPIVAAYGSQDGPSVAAAGSKATESAKGVAHASAPAQNAGGGGLRRAVLELVSSVECLCGDAANRDVVGAKRHLDEAKRLIDAPSRDGDRRGASDARPSVSSAPGAPREGGTEETRQDLQRAMR